jgi:enoyl-CoA hydratase/carnithine racemase
VQRLDWTAFTDLVASPVQRRDLGDSTGAMLVIAGPVPSAMPDELVRAAVGLQAIVAVDFAVPAPESVKAVADVITCGDELDAVVQGFEANPIAAGALTMLLRDSERRSVEAGLAAESAVYSTLQAGPEFAAWRKARPPQTRAGDDGPRVAVDRAGDVLEVTLVRPQARNALDARMRDELWDAFQVALADAALQVRWRAAGPAFSSGGDLDEFGTRPDPATAHLVRMARSLGSILHELADRVSVELHGACFGSGIELPAFAGRVVASPDTSIALPELALGLIPGAGGTVSLPRRIGRHRTLLLALTGRTVDAPTALEWGLVDELGAAPPPTIPV